MRKLISRGTSSICVAASFAMLVDIEVHDRQVIPYLRFIEFGSLRGLAQTVFKDQYSLYDCIVNTDDAERLASRQSRKGKGESDHKEVIDMWEECCEAVREIIDADVKMFLVLEKHKAKPVVHHIGLSTQVLSTQMKAVSESMTLKYPCLRHVVHLSPDEAKSHENLLFQLNCLPNINPMQHSSNSKNPLLRDIWQSTGVRSRFMNGLDVDEADIRFAFASSVPVDKMKRARRKGNAPIEMSAAMSSESNFWFNAVPWIEESDVFMETPMHKSFMQSLRGSGLIRLVRNDSTEVKVLWNGYCPSSGQMLNSKFCITSSFLDDDVMHSIVCYNCQSFQLSIDFVNSESDNALGFCFHTKLFSVIVPFVRKFNTGQSTTPSNDIELWVLRHLANNDCVTLMSKHNGVTKLLVQVGDGTAKHENTDEVAVCVVERISENNIRAGCSSVHCQRKKLKRMKKGTTVSKLCCHLRACFASAHIEATSQTKIDCEDCDLTASLGEQCYCAHFYIFHCYCR
jgi:CRISPR/Cas system-associated endoribonuclease Cas2